MHPEIDDFIKIVKRKFPEYFEGKKVLEVGSQNINGSVRSHFKDCDYLGIDLGEAPGVDHIVDATEMTYWHQFDVMISSEMLEHCKKWERALQNMYDAVKPGGIFILTCAGPARHEHGTSNHTPQDSKFTLEHYRNISVEDFESVLPKTFFKESLLGLYRGDTDLYFWGIKI
jgi:SAM-dependent methyltransferase